MEDLDKKYQEELETGVIHLKGKTVYRILKITGHILYIILSCTWILNLINNFSQIRSSMILDSFTDKWESKNLDERLHRKFICKNWDHLKYSSYFNLSSYCKMHTTSVFV